MILHVSALSTATARSQHERDTCHPHSSHPQAHASNSPIRRAVQQRARFREYRHAPRKLASSNACNRATLAKLNPPTTKHARTPTRAHPPSSQHRAQSVFVLHLRRRFHFTPQRSASQCSCSLRSVHIHTHTHAHASRARRRHAADTRNTIAISSPSSARRRGGEADRDIAHSNIVDSGDSAQSQKRLRRQHKPIHIHTHPNTQARVSSASVRACACECVCAPK